MPAQRPARLPRRGAHALDAFLTSHQPRAFLDELRLRLLGADGMAWREATSCETIGTQRPSRVWRRCQDRFDACAPVACGLLAFQRGRPNLTQLASPIGWRAGACASRKLSVSLRHVVGEPGNWSAASRGACVQRCLSVENCRHVTHSQASGRCSLFAACRKLTVGQQARGRQTLLVRDELEGERSRLAYDSTDGEACDARSRMPVWAASDRRYEDCMGPLTARREDGSGATTCEPSLVGLRGDCRGGSCSPFSATALVVFVSHPERVPILHAYAKWFASLTFMVTGSAACAACKEALERLRPASAGAHTDATESGSSCTCVDDFDNTRPYGVGANYSGVGNVHISFARVMLRVASARPGLAGIVYMHADFVLNVRRFAGAPLADIWTARAGLSGRYRDPCCYPLDNPIFRRSPFMGRMGRSNTEWPWFGGAHRACHRAARLIGATHCCFGWSDFVYMPLRLLDTFTALLQRMGELFHEAAVPTAINRLAKSHGATWRLLPRCEGSATAGQLLASQLHKQLDCGHRLNLGDASHAAALRRLLD